MVLPKAANRIVSYRRFSNDAFHQPCAQRRLCGRLRFRVCCQHAVIRQQEHVMSVRFRFVSILVGLLIPSLSVASYALAQAADAIYTGGPIITMNEAAPRAEAVAIKDGKIIAVGTKADDHDRPGGQGPASRVCRRSRARLYHRHSSRVGEPPARSRWRGQLRREDSGDPARVRQERRVKEVQPHPGLRV
jgi:hypothetical protein